MPGNDGIRRASFGIFDRAGFGTVTFRRDSMAATLFAVQNDDRYRVNHHLSDLSLVVFDFGCSTICQILLGQMSVWQNRQDGWSIQIKVNQTQVRVPPCIIFISVITGEWSALGEAGFNQKRI